MNKPLVASIVVGIFGTLATAYLSGVRHDKALAKEVARLEKEYAGHKALADLAVEEQKRIVEAKQAELDGATTLIEKLTAAKRALLSELDSDGDGVHIPTDLCGGKPEAGQPSAVNTKGCLDNEAALSCKAVRDTVDQPGVQWEFYDCPLADDADIAYVCTGVIENNAWKSITDCHSFDRAHPGG